MDSGGLIRPCLLLFISICVCVVSGNPLYTTVIDCTTDSSKEFGPVDEGYEGDVEVVTGIAAGSGVKLVPYLQNLFDQHLEYLELSFTIGDTSATVRTKKPLDADTLTDSGGTLFYSIMCDGVIKYNNTRRLKIDDINDNSPIFEEKLYSKSVSESEPVGFEVVRVKATDADRTAENNAITYSLEPASEDFEMTSSGVLRLKRRLNYNLVQQYNFIVTASDPFGLSDTATVTINVEDFDNLNPYFSHSLYRAFISENQGGPLPTIEPEAIKAQDGDTGINVALTYSISEVSPAEYQSNFNIDPSSGVLSVQTPIDREEMSSSVISVSIKAAQTDDSLKTANAVVSVTIEDVNDNAPKFDRSNYSVSLPENFPVDAVVFKAVITDLDQGGFVGTLRILPESAPFSIGSDGTVRVKDSTVLDRETTTSFTFEIEATETNPPNSVATAEVNVTLLDENDNSPVFTSNKYEGKVFANQTEGMLLVQVEAEDVDDGANAQITYSIDFGNTDGYFSIDDKTGKITLAKEIPLVEYRILEFPLYITARDGGTISRSTTAQVIIRASGDSKPQFLEGVYRGTIAEEQDPQVLILRVNFQAIKPATLQVDTHSDKFSISSTGEFATKVKLDYDEGRHNYSVMISISDGVSSDSAVVEVQVTDVNDNSPVFASSSVTTSVPEDSEVGSSVTVVPATDKDISFNKEIRYSLRGGEGMFDIDPVSGMVSVAGALDRETKAEYNLLVVAEDQGRPARSATASLLVQVSDVNDNAPEFSSTEYQVEVLETESVGKSLLTLSAVDPDEGPNGKVSYSIVQQSPSSDPAVFELDSSSGTLQLAKPLDYSEVKVYSLLVQASDAGTPSLVRNGSVVVKVKDVNNNPPVFSKESYDVAILENLASGASILTLDVTDRDKGGFSDGDFIYTSDTFDINKQGVVTLKKDVALDRETKDNYILEVVAVDQATDGLSATVQLNITVLDYNDNAPQFPLIADPLQIPEGNYSEENPGDVVTIMPTDADLGPNGEVTLSLSSPHPLFRFTEDGTLLAVGALDRESRETYELLVKASDNGTPQRESITTIRVSLTDVNDNRPEFSSSSYVSSILLKDAEKGKLLLTLEATDKDDGDNSLITYSFSAGSSPYLALNSTTGAVTLTSDLADVKEDTTLVLTATAEDHGEPPLSSTARVVVNLRVVSLVEGVGFGSSSYNFSIPEHRTVGTVVGTVFASSGSDLYNVSYTLKKHTDLFSIDTSGAVETKAELDKEEKEWYVLDVEAVDTRTPPTTAVAMVTVQVEDVNEPPQFSKPLYEASVVSIAPYKTPIVTVEASDPDVSDQCLLVYSLSVDSTHFDVDPSTGLVSVDSAVELAGQKVELKVHVDDLQGLRATTTVEVTVGGSVSSSDVVVIRLNQRANTVESKIPDVENSLTKVLGCTVDVIEVSNTNRRASESRMKRAAVWTQVSFICLDGGTVVSGEEVTTKLLSQSEDVRAELIKVFGDSLQFEVKLQVDPESPASNQAVVIALGVLVPLIMLGSIVGLLVRLKKTKKTKSHREGSEESFDMSRGGEGFENKAWTDSEFKQRHSLEVQPDFNNDSVRTDNDSVRGRQTDNNGRHISAL